jgi:hypothetical protein
VFPSRAEVATRLRTLIADGDRPAAAAWAERYMEVLEGLSGADEPSTDREFLYGPTDFQVWLDRLS